MATVYGYPARDDIIAGRTYIARMPRSMSAKKFADAKNLVKGIGERPGSTAEYADGTWTVTLAADANGAVDDLRLAEAKYDVTVEMVPADNYADASDAHSAINTTGLPRQIETIDQARDSYDAAWKALGAAKDAVLAAQDAAAKAERAWGDASVTLQRFEADEDAARRAAVTCPRCPHQSDAS
jgi:hypothetical protein